MKKIETEIKRYLNKNKNIKEALSKSDNEQKILQIIPQKIKKGIRKIEIKKQTIYIKTKTPSWRQETLVFKKEILEIIHKKVRNYTISKIIIL